MSTFDDAVSFLGEVGSNKVCSVAYDTAWLASLRAGDSGTAASTPLFPECLEWISNNQNPDGSWGGPWSYYHDRLVSTLRAILTLNTWHLRRGDRRSIERGIRYIWKNAARLGNDPYETVAFELIFPSMLRDAAQQKLELPFSAFDSVVDEGNKKLARVGIATMYRRDTPLATSIEALGPDFQHDLAGDLQEESGGVAISPGATAFLLRRWPENELARSYLQRTVREGSDGGAPSVFPIETFERSWALYHLLWARPQLRTELPAIINPLLQFISSTVTSTGWATSEFFTIKESDSTAVCFAVLARAGYELDPELIYQYEEADHFRCYPFERNPSVSANIHILEALRYCDPERREPKIAKVLGFLRRLRQPEGFWFDKWHVSPYYPTSHAILAAYDLEPDLMRPAVDWMVHTQDEGGGWGYFAPTVEETAYAMISLLTWREAGNPVPSDVLDQGMEYLRHHAGHGQDDFPPLWIGKSLYTPAQVVESAVLAAMLRYEDPA